MTDPLFSMAYLTANGADPFEAIDIAHQAGFDMISFRMLPGTPTDTVAPFLEDPAYLSRVISALKAADLSVPDIEMIRIKPDTDPQSFHSFFAACEKIGAHHVLTVVDDPNLQRSMDTFGNLCRVMQNFGLTADLEFMPFSEVKDAKSAHDIILATGEPNGRVLIDSLHVDRSNTPIRDLCAIAPTQISYLQICDGFKPCETDTASLIHVARQEREIPGQGNIDLETMFASLRAPIISVEVPNQRLLRTLTKQQLAIEALTESKLIIAKAWQ